MKTAAWGRYCSISLLLLKKVETPMKTKKMIMVRITARSLLSATLLG